MSGCSAASLHDSTCSGEASVVRQNALRSAVAVAGAATRREGTESALPSALRSAVDVAGVTTRRDGTESAAPSARIINEVLSRCVADAERPAVSASTRECSGDSVLLRGLGFSLMQGQHLLLQGPSGSGTVRLLQKTHAHQCCRFSRNTA